MRIMRFMDVDLKLNITFFVWPAIFVYNYYTTADKDFAVFWAYYVTVLFFFVLTHEVAHTIALKLCGFKVKHITLTVLGGATVPEGLPEKPLQELFVAAMGPASNLLFAGIAFGVFKYTEHLNINWLLELLIICVFVNLLLAVFNLVPAFPLDGGRVLRALLSLKMKRNRATWLMATVSEVIAIVFAIWIIRMGRGYYLNLIMVPIVLLASELEARAVAKKAITTEPEVHEQVIEEGSELAFEWS